MKTQKSARILLLVFLLTINVGFLKADPYIQHVKFTHNAKYIITVGYNTDGSKLNGIQLWDSKTAARVRFIPIESAMQAIDISPDDKYIAFTSGLKVLIYDLETGVKAMELADAKQESATRDLQYMPNGKSIIVAQDDGVAYMWDIATKTITRKMKIKGKQGHIGISPNGKMMVSGDDYLNVIKLWDLETGKEIETFKLEGEKKDDGVSTIAWDDYSNNFVTAGRSMPVYWSSSSKGMVRRYEDFEGTAEFVGWSFDNDNFWFCGYKDVFKTTLTRNHPYTSYASHTNYITGVDFSPNKLYFLTCDGSGNTKLWDAANGLQLFTFYHFQEGETYAGDYLPYLHLSNNPIEPTFVSNITDTDLKYFKAERKYQAGKYAEAKILLVDYIRSAYPKFDPHFTPYLYLGVCEYMIKEYDSAILDFKADLEYDYARALYSIAACYALKNDTANAIEWLQKDQNSEVAFSKDALLKEKDWANYLNLPAFQRIMSEDKRSAFKKHIDECDAFLAKGETDNAMKAVEAAIADQPNWAQGYHAMGSLYMMQKKYGEAYIQFKKENEIEDKYENDNAKKYGGYQQIGQAYSFMSNFGASIEYTKKAIAGNKTFYLGYPDLATFMIRDKQYKDAVSVMLDYNRCAPDDDFGYYMTALAYSWAGDDEKKKEYAQKAIYTATAAGNKVPDEYTKMLGN
jgi:tetratricopeptide (TPR) repeat protein